jgi:hypothetical protein
MQRQLRESPPCLKRFLDQIGDGGLAGASESCEPRHAGRLMHERRSSRLVDEMADLSWCI